MTFNLKVSTPHGEFTRKATKAYTHVVVRKSERAMKSFNEPVWDSSGVQQRWQKDRGFAVTWHGSEGAARAAASKPYVWDSKTGPAEVFAVEANMPLLAAMLPKVG
jgi:hypothetical protein